MMIFICFRLGVIGENLTGWIKYTHAVEGYMETVIADANANLVHNFS